MTDAAAFDRDLADLEAAVLDVARDADTDAPHRLDERDLVAALDHLLNTYPVSEERLLGHLEEVRRIHETRRTESTASKHVDTVHQVFLDDVCPDYEPRY